MRFILVSLSALTAVVALGLAWMGYRGIDESAVRGISLILVALLVGVVSCTLAVFALIAPPEPPAKNLDS